MNKVSPLLLTAVISATASASAYAGNVFIAIIDPAIYSASIDGEEGGAAPSNTYNIANNLSSLDVPTNFAYNASYGGFYSTLFESFNTIDAISGTASEITSSYAAARITEGIDVSNLSRVEAKLFGDFEAQIENGLSNLAVGFISLIVEYDDGTTADAFGYYDKYSRDARGVSSIRNAASFEERKSLNKLNGRTMYFNIPADKHGTVKDVWIRGGGVSGYNLTKLGLKDITLHTGDVTTDPAPAGTPTYLEWHADRFAGGLFADTSNFAINTTLGDPLYGAVTARSYHTGSFFPSSTALLSDNHGTYHTALATKPGDYSDVVRIEAELTGDYRNGHNQIGLLVEYTDDSVVTAFAYYDPWLSNSDGSVVRNNGAEIHSRHSSEIYYDETFYYDIPAEKQGLIRNVYIWGSLRSSSTPSIAKLRNLRFFLRR